MINRDGANLSLWQDSIQPYKSGTKASTRQLYDVIIVGGGITGMSTALLLQESGKKCLLLEAANLCFGTTGGTTAHLNTLLDVPYSDISKNFGKEAAKIVADATKDAIQLIRNHIKQYNIDCGFSDANGYLFAQDEKQEDPTRFTPPAQVTAPEDVGEYRDEEPDRHHPEEENDHRPHHFPEGQVQQYGSHRTHLAFELYPGAR